MSLPCVRYQGLTLVFAVLCFTTLAVGTPALPVGCEFSEADNFTLASCSSFRGSTLDLGQSGIVNILDGAFEGLSHVKNLLLGGNHLKQVGDLTFAGLEGARNLDLSSNSLHTITPFAFATVRQLTVLRLDNNQLSIVPADAFQPLENLRSVNLQNNDFAEPCSSAGHFSGHILGAQYCGVVSAPRPACAARHSHVRMDSAAAASAMHGPAPYHGPVFTTASICEHVHAQLRAAHHMRAAEAPGGNSTRARDAAVAPAPLLTWDPRAVFHLAQHPHLCDGDANKAVLHYVLAALAHAEATVPPELLPTAADTVSLEAWRGYFNRTWYAPRFNPRRPWLGRLAVPRREALLRKLVMSTPRNIVDGVWAGVTAGPHDDLDAVVFAVLAAEVGDVTAAPHLRNHATAWRRSMIELGFAPPPPVSSLAFLSAYPKDAFWNAALSVAVPRVHGPALRLQVFGFTLNLEMLSTPTTMRRARQMAALGYDPEYYSVHGSVDNPVTGHGAWIRDAIGKHVALHPADAEQVIIGCHAFALTQELTTEDGELVMQLPTQPPARAWQPAAPAANPGGDESAPCTVTWEQVKAQGLVVLGDRAYDFSSWIPHHPGDKRHGTIASWRGRNATLAFGLIHPGGRAAQLREYEVGVVARGSSGSTDAHDPTPQLPRASDAGTALHEQVAAALAQRGVHDVAHYHHPRTPVADIFKAPLPRANATHPYAAARVVLERLAKTELIDCGAPESSRFLAKAKSGGPMFGVLSEDAIRAWLGEVCGHAER